MMKLELIRTKEEREENVAIKSSIYKLGGYYKVFYRCICHDEKLYYKIISVSVDFEEHNKNYLPEIYFDESKSQFKIQTTSWGTMDTDEIKKIIAGYNTAIEAVEMLTAALL